MKWFFALNESSGWFSHYASMLKVAVHSALTRTTLHPHFLYDGEENDLTDWLSDRGVTIIRCRTSLYSLLQSEATRTKSDHVLSIGAGAFLRVDLPRLTSELGIDDPCVLYTDCDVMFLGDVAPALSRMQPFYFAAAPEVCRGNFLDMNTGVMVMNLKALREQDRPFRAFVNRHLAHIIAMAFDQGAYRIYYTPLWRFLTSLRVSKSVQLRLAFSRLHPHIKFRWDCLPETCNWKPYWGENDQAQIIHFHGPKPHNRPAAGLVLPPAYQPLSGGAYLHYCKMWDELLAQAD